MKMGITGILLCIGIECLGTDGRSVREKISFDKDWKFSFGHASDRVKDFGYAIEYFTYFTKAGSIHNAGPYNPGFNDSAWVNVGLPHDWVVRLPFAPEASHSHGYKTVGYKYPGNSVGWYRKKFRIEEKDLGKHISIRFDGIFRDAVVWVNGFYLGREESGYLPAVYDITEYLRYGEDNVVTVRADASVEEGWYYEGAGIYRHVWLEKTSPLCVVPFGTFVYCDIAAPYGRAEVNIETEVANHFPQEAKCSLKQYIYDEEGELVATAESPEEMKVLPEATGKLKQRLEIIRPRLWAPEHPYLYELQTHVYREGTLCDVYTTPFGIREIRFDPDKGFFLNGKPVKIKGTNNHQDHPGVGIAIPDSLQAYRIRRLKSFGCNAYRSSHHPMTPELLDVCDREGMLVLEENRLSGVNRIHREWLERMIRRDRNHPSVILWSIGNEEWAFEGNPAGTRIAGTMRNYVRLLDPTRPVTYGNSGGREALKSVDVQGYNYLIQNSIEENRMFFPGWKGIGTEETSGCGTRGIYTDDAGNGRMKAFNRGEHKGTVNIIERGWKFYDERPWLGGLFYWTGFDYRGEPNPLAYPATGSQFGILDYCGFPKDEAFYLKAWWTDEPVLHIFPHWNWAGHENEEIEVWAYSNCDEIELFLNGKSQGRRKMYKNGHSEWKVKYRPGTLKAVGYRGNKKTMTISVATTGPACRIEPDPVKTVIKAGRNDLAIVNIRLTDREGRTVPTACQPLQMHIEGDGRILGGGNGDPAFRVSECPAEGSPSSFGLRAFNGLAQVLLQADCPGRFTLVVTSDDMPPVRLPFTVK